MLRTALSLAAVLLTSASALATPAGDRTAAFEVLTQETVVERAFSNCRWIRGTPDEARLRRWRDDNRDVVAAAKAVIDGQGGLTEPRRKIVDALAGSMGAEMSASKDACRKFYEAVAAGEHDLTVKVPTHLLQQVMKAPKAKGEGDLWIVEQRRLPTGVLTNVARRYEGGGDILDCEAQGAGKGHISFRQRIGPDMEVLPDPDPELWMAECMVSPVNPITGDASAAKGGL